MRDIRSIFIHKYNAHNICGHKMWIDHVAVSYLYSVFTLPCLITQVMESTLHLHSNTEDPSKDSWPPLKELPAARQSVRGKGWGQGAREGSLQKLGGSHRWKRRWDASEGQDSCYWK